MKLKQRIGDFRVRELLADGYLQERGDHAVYRVTKRKLTTHEAARILAQEAGIDAAEVGMAGLKDRQATTIQYMSVATGRPVRLRSPELLIEPVGRAAETLSSAVSLGNAFELVVRDLDPRDLQALRRNVPIVREHGVINYFDEQRFGNVKHNQGWIARYLMRGEAERALRELLAARSPHDNDKRKRFKTRVQDLWGDWRACRDEAGHYGQHHSVFEHLIKSPDDFAGAFQRVAGRLRLIHLYAYQSHLWNRALCEWVRREVPVERRIVLDSIEGSLITFAGAPPAGLAGKTSFRLPGEGLEDVEDPLERELFEAELERQHLAPGDFRIENMPGFQLKGEARSLRVVPRHLRVRPPEDDPMHRGARLVRVRFELPRGSYATLVVKRLLAVPLGPGGEEGRRGGGFQARHARGDRLRTPGQGGRRLFARPTDRARDDRDEPEPSDRRGRERGASGGDRGARREGGRGGGSRGGGSWGRRGDGERDRDEDRGRDRGGRYGRDDRGRGGRGRGERDRTGRGGRGADDRGEGRGSGRDDRGRGYDRGRGERDRYGSGGRGADDRGGGRGSGRDDRGRGDRGRYRGGERDSRDRSGRDDRGRYRGGDRDSRDRSGRDDRGRYQGGDRDSRDRSGRDDRGRYRGGERDSRDRSGRDDRGRYRGGERDARDRSGRDDRGRGGDGRYRRDDRGTGGRYGRDDRGQGRDDRGRGGPSRAGGDRSRGGRVDRDSAGGEGRGRYRDRDDRDRAGTRGRGDDRRGGGGWKGGGRGRSGDGGGRSKGGRGGSRRDAASRGGRSGGSERKQR